jgi:hypothetical protein
MASILPVPSGPPVLRGGLLRADTEVATLPPLSIYMKKLAGRLFMGEREVDLEGLLLYQELD